MALAFLDRDHSIAPAGYSRWLVPPAALAIHLSIGQVYAFSVFKNPLLAMHGADGSAWNLKEVGYIFSIAIAFLRILRCAFRRVASNVFQLLHARRHPLLFVGASAARQTGFRAAVRRHRRGTALDAWQEPAKAPRR